MIAPLESYKASLHSKTRKQEIQRISQENLEFSKRLIDKKPCLDKKKWESDYTLSKYYMSKICEFPSMNFEKRSQIDSESVITQTGTVVNSSTYHVKSSSTGFRDANSQVSLSISKFNKTSTKEKFIAFRKLVEGNTFIYSLEYSKHIEDEFGVKTSLYSKRMSLDEIDDCYCKCYIENKKFVISIAPVISSYHSSHFLIFDDYDEVVKLSRDYKSYEDILKNLEYRDNVIHIKTRNEELKYVSLPYNFVRGQIK